MAEEKKKLTKEEKSKKNQEIDSTLRRKWLKKRLGPETMMVIPDDLVGVSEQAILNKWNVMPFRKVPKNYKLVKSGILGHDSIQTHYFRNSKEKRLMDLEERYEIGLGRIRYYDEVMDWKLSDVVALRTSDNEYGSDWLLKNRSKDWLISKHPILSTIVFSGKYRHSNEYIRLLPDRKIPLINKSVPGIRKTCRIIGRNLFYKGKATRSVMKPDGTINKRALSFWGKTVFSSKVGHCCFWLANYIDSIFEYNRDVRFLKKAHKECSDMIEEESGRKNTQLLSGVKLVRPLEKTAIVPLQPKTTTFSNLTLKTADGMDVSLDIDLTLRVGDAGKFINSRYDIDGKKIKHKKYKSEEADLQEFLNEQFKNIVASVNGTQLSGLNLTYRDSLIDELISYFFYFGISVEGLKVKNVKFSEEDKKKIAEQQAKEQAQKAREALKNDAMIEAYDYFNDVMGKAYDERTATEEERKKFMEFFMMIYNSKLGYSSVENGRTSSSGRGTR